MTIGERIKRRRQLRGWSVRLAADRAGISHASWSRIERGLQAADNRFVLGGIAAALECSIVELTGAVMPAGDRRAAAAQLGVHAIRVALVEIDPDQDDTGPGRPVAELNEELALVRRLRHECDYARAVALMPGLLRDLQAAGRGPERRAALRMLCEASFLASSLLRSLGHPADAWLGAERCRDVAAETEDPVLLGLAAFARACAASACGSYDRELALAEGGIAALDPHAGAPGALEMLGVLHLIGARPAGPGSGDRDDGRRERGPGQLAGGLLPHGSGPGVRGASRSRPGRGEASAGGRAGRAAARPFVAARAGDGAESARPRAAPVRWHRAARAVRADAGGGLTDCGGSVSGPGPGVSPARRAGWWPGGRR